MLNLDHACFYATALSTTTRRKRLTPPSFTSSSSAKVAAPSKLARGGLDIVDAEPEPGPIYRDVSPRRRGLKGLAGAPLEPADADAREND